ncbi:hypothetical protein J6590_089675 [Homalodisca vitripennis]|nr:hypothetical protein J6590_089675 [Homalodisca vitripennis]
MQKLLDHRVCSSVLKFTYNFVVGTTSRISMARPTNCCEEMKTRLRLAGGYAPRPPK